MLLEVIFRALWGLLAPNSFEPFWSAQEDPFWAARNLAFQEEYRASLADS